MGRGLRRQGKVLVKLPRHGGRATALGFGQHPHHAHAARQGKGQHVAGPDPMGRFFHALAVDPDLTSGNERCGQAPVFCEAGVNQPLVKALAQFFPWFIWAFRASSTAKGDSGSAFFSLRGGWASMTRGPRS